MIAARAFGAVVLTAAAFLAACDPTRPFRVINDPRPVRHVVIAPDTLRVSLGDTARFTVRVLSAGDREATEHVVAWTAGNPAVADPVGGGQFAARAIGVSEILATASGVRGRAILVVR